MAPRDVVPGTIYAEQIVEALRTCAALILICSRNIESSTHVRNEVERAFSFHKPIIPFRMEKVELGAALEYFLGSAHWLDAWDLSLEESAVRIAEAILARLGNRLPLLSRGAGDAPVRQITLENAIAWSCDLLADDEKCLFRWVSIFAGGFSLEAAEAVCAQMTAKSLVSWTAFCLWSIRACSRRGMFGESHSSACWKPCASTHWAGSLKTPKRRR